MKDRVFLYISYLSIHLQNDFNIWIYEKIIFDLGVAAATLCFPNES